MSASRRIRRSVTGLDFIQSVCLGAALGAALGGLFLLIGLVGFFLFRAGGGQTKPISWSDVRQIGFYVGGFALAGAFLGLVRPVLHRRGAVYAAMAAGGAIVMNVIAIGDKGISGMDGVDWIAMTLLGVVFGLAGARGYLGKA